MAPATPSRTDRLVHAFRRLGPVMAVPGAIFLFSLPMHSSSAGSTEHMAVDAAIVFAIDMSSSIGPNHADMQRLGHAEALRSSDVAAAIASGATGCIAIAYVEWSVPGWLRTVLPWTKICSEGDRLTAADEIAARGDTGLERRGRGGTAISYALEASGLLLDRLPGRADRKIIDISANGTNNGDMPVAHARERVLAKGYVINAIVLDQTEPGINDDLTGYFRDRVIGGVGAFVVVPDGPADFATALRRKLVLEISEIDRAEKAGSHLLAWVEDNLQPGQAASQPNNQEEPAWLN